ncbi:MAG: GNAT family N-acetyltransferase [Jatrophihabitans sp.]
MTQPTVEPITGRGFAASILARAFHDDPVMAWMMPTRRDIRLRRFFRGLLRYYVPEGACEVTSDGTAAAVWVPPGRIVPPIGRQLAALPLLAAAAGRRIGEAGRTFDTAQKLHPKEPFWYLIAIGTVPERRGAGRGSILLRSRLAHVDEAGLPAYLESSNETNIPFYKGHGFEVVNTIGLADGVREWGMLRPARG